MLLARQAAVSSGRRAYVVVERVCCTAWSRGITIFRNRLQSPGPRRRFTAQQGAQRVYALAESPQVVSRDTWLRWVMIRQPYLMPGYLKTQHTF